MLSVKHNGSHFNHTTAYVAIQGPTQQAGNRKCGSGEMCT